MEDARSWRWWLFGIGHPMSQPFFLDSLDPDKKLNDYVRNLNYKIHDQKLYEFGNTYIRIGNEGERVTDKLCFCPDKTVTRGEFLAMAMELAGIDPEIVIEANKIANTDIRKEKCVNVGEISSESGVGEALNAKRTEVYDNAVVASEAEFDKVWDDGMADYMGAGGQDIKDDRTSKWQEVYGDTDTVPAP